MSLVEKNWSDDVMAALALVREEVGKATRQIQQAGGAEMARGNMAIAKKAIGYIDKLDEFMIQMEDVGEKWAQVQASLDADLESVKEVVLPKSVRNVKPGFTRNVTEVAPWTNFTARINGGELISEPTARAAFVKALQQFDLEELASLDTKVNGEPLLSKDRSVFKKYSKVDSGSVLPVKDGWYANVYTSTATKVRLLEEFANACGVKVELNVVPHASAHGTPKTGTTLPGTTVLAVKAPISKPGKKDRSNDGRNVPGVPFKVSQVVMACFPEVFRRGLVSDNEVEYLQTKDASKQFKTGGNPVLKLNRGIEADRLVTAPTGFKKNRFYPESRALIQHRGRKFYLSCEFSPGALAPVVEWLGEKGISKDEINKLVEGCNVEGK